MGHLGCVILDADCVHFLENPDTLATIKGSLRSSGLEIWPTASNVVEATKTSNPHVRRRLLNVLRTLAGRSHLLPDPHDLLKQVSESIIQGKPGFVSRASGMEWLLDETVEITEEFAAKAHELSEKADAELELANDLARPRMLPLALAPETVAKWSTAEQFLDEQWMRLEQLDVLIDTAWKAFGLAGTPPYERLLADETWRLYLEGWGIGIYRGALARERGRRVQSSDLHQLAYLGGRERRLLVTNDKGFYQAATSVLVGRHRLARVLKWHELLACAEMP